MSNEDYRNWLQSLEVGDSVFYDGRSENRILKVVRLTMTLMELSNGTRVRRSNGKILGASVWECSEILEATPERIRSVVISVRRRKLSNFNFAMLSDDQISRMCDIINEETQYE